jgi:hypothetical protein
MIYRVYDKGNIVQDFDTLKEATSFIYGYCKVLGLKAEPVDYGTKISKFNISDGTEFFIQELEQ